MSILDSQHWDKYAGRLKEIERSLMNELIETRDPETSGKIKMIRTALALPDDLWPKENLEEEIE